VHQRLVAKMLLFHVCLLLLISMACGLQGADFDIYPSFSASDDDADSSSSKSADLASRNRLLSRVGATIGIGGGAFIGFQLVKKVVKSIRRASGHTASSLTDVENDINNQRSKDASFNVTTITEMKKEQEELWRFIHSLFKNQEEMMAKLEKNVNSGVPESAVRELEESFNLKIRDISKRLDSLESKLKVLERDMPELSQKPSVTEESVQSLIQSEVSELSNSMTVLKKEIKNQMLRWLKEHDDAIVEKIRYFGEDIKKLVKSDSTDSESVSSSSSNYRNVKPKPRGNAGSSKMNSGQTREN
jgi:hypothetical protein